MSGDDAPKNERSYPWDVLHWGPLSIVKLLRSSVPCAHSRAAGYFTGSGAGGGGGGSTALASANMHCKEEKYTARLCGACKPEFAFLKYFSFNNPLEYN